MNRTDDLASEASSGASAVRGSVRWAVRGACLLAAVLVLLVAPGRAQWAWVVPALSPLVAVASLLCTRTIQAAAALGMLVGLIAVVRRRWFCRWACPTGLCADVTSRLRKKGDRHRGSDVSPTAEPTRATEPVPLFPPRVPPLGQWILWITLGGACLGYPLLLWLDPLAIFAAMLTWTGPQSATASAWAALGMAAALLVSLLLPGAWCARICPLGATQDVLSLIPRAIRRGAGCQPAGNTADGRSTPRRPVALVLRRAVLFGVVGAVAAAAAKKARAGATRPLRPPGALDEAHFTGACIRCGNCTRACPTRIIEPDPGAHGLLGLLAPVVSFRQGYCLEDCTRCTEVCPSGALVRLAPHDKLLAPLGYPRVDMEICLLGDDQECSVCRNCCPYEAISLRFSEATYTLTPQIDARKCPGCGACEAACPTAPVKAVVVRPR